MEQHEGENETPATSAPQVESDTKPPKTEKPSEDEEPHAVPSTVQSAQISLQQITDRALRFLSTASNETIGACLVGLGAGTYMVLGRVGLVLIGVVGGVVLHATWEGGSSGSANETSKTVEEKRRKEVGLDVIHRILSWRSQKETEKDDLEDATPVKVDAFSLAEEDLQYSKFKPETADALRQITDAVIRDYVRFWYSPILPEEPEFPATCRQTLTSFILSISNNLSRKRPADTFVNFVMNTSSITTVFLSELSTALSASPNVAPADAIRTYVEFKSDSNLANILDMKQQRKKLSLVAEDILQTYLEPKTYNCNPAHVFLRQILANTVIDNTIELCSKPEWINGWIVYLLEDGEPELLKEVDAGLEGPTGNAVKNVEKQIAVDEASTDTLPELSPADVNHRRVVSRGQEAFDDAMREAARLTRLMQEEDARLAQKQTTTNQDVEETRQSSIEDNAALAAAGAVGMIDAGPMVSTASITSVQDDHDHSENTTQGIVTPTSSQSERNQGSEGGSDRGHSTESQQVDPAAPSTPSENAPSSGFTSFDQIIPPTPPTALVDNPDGLRQERDPLTLYKSTISIFDDSVPGDRTAIKSKPTAEYLIQIEPASSQHSGWMIAKKYADIEHLHETIRRISAISGAGFEKIHATVPGWKGRTKAQFREDLERYLSDAVRSRQLAESDATRRFFDKDQNLTKTPSGKGGINSAFETMGKGMKDVAGGGKALIGGVAGVFGGIGPKRTSTSSSNPTSVTRSNAGSPAPHNRSESILSAISKTRQSTDSLRKTISNADSNQASSPIERRLSITPEPDPPSKARPASPTRSSIQLQPSPPNSKPSSIRGSVEMSAAHGGDQFIQLPPPPSEIQDDYNTTSDVTASVSTNTDPLKRRPESIFSASTAADPSDDASVSESKSPISAPQLPPRPPKPSKEYPPLTEQETTVAIELLFAVITELYTLSSAWSLRRTLLTAAKTFLLRPGNPQLESIRQLLQSTVLDANTSDAGIAAQLRKLRENSLPTQAELATWPKEPTEEQKEELRIKARKLLVERGMPVALTSVMGQAASGEAVGKVFDCLQVKEVARGLMFGLMLQGIRAVVQ
ncbi:hypothetical protein NA57DRAFT_64606 [Rhizodiscina lignyota]|uniref:PXA domain-containing protein n=1 Tax=Rhizodiscina lignyota TaxID=1504668 RepID=A0A9P4M9C3_9PEZI|nr:hypothetical protein NA57DRAFT_64606 [Rhizodiscina lignyota]